MPSPVSISAYPNYGVTKTGQVWVYPRKDNYGRVSGGRWLNPVKQKNLETFMELRNN